MKRYIPVIAYTCGGGDPLPSLLPNPDGEWVRFEDAEKRILEVEKKDTDANVLRLESELSEAVTHAEYLERELEESCPECNGQKALPGVSPEHTEGCTTCQGFTPAERETVGGLLAAGMVGVEACDLDAAMVLCNRIMVMTHA